MRLRVRIIISFAVTFLIVLGAALIGIYLLMSLNRHQEFIQRIKDKTTTTFRLLIDVQGIDHDILQTLDRNTINSLYNEKVMLFDSLGTNIYSSMDDTPILFPRDVIEQLKHGETELVYRDGAYDVYAHVIRDRGSSFYAIGKAEDIYGQEKLRFLKIVLIVIFFVVTLIVIVMSYVIANQISAPILTLTQEVNNRSIANLSRIQVEGAKGEIKTLQDGFNGMLVRLEDAYQYQKNFIHHVSHELKTPIAVLISNLERTAASGDQNLWRSSFEFQKDGLMQIASVINTLLEISKFETNSDVLSKSEIRLDELIFETFATVEHAIPDARLNLSIDESLSDAEELAIPGNERMLQIALLNLIKNGVEYSDDKTVTCQVKKDREYIELHFLNTGPTLTLDEQPRLFQQFFRGKNTSDKAGIGLGLVMASKIIKLHDGELSYQVENGRNCFSVKLRS